MESVSCLGSFVLKECRSRVPLSRGDLFEVLGWACGLEVVVG